VQSPTKREREPLLTTNIEDYLRVFLLGGTIKRDEQMTFKRMIYRATRGKAYSYFFDLKIDPADRMSGNKDPEERNCVLDTLLKKVYT